MSLGRFLQPQSHRFGRRNSEGDGALEAEIEPPRAIDPPAPSAPARAPAESQGQPPRATGMRGPALDVATLSAAVDAGRPVGPSPEQLRRALFDDAGPASRTAAAPAPAMAPPPSRRAAIEPEEEDGDLGAAPAARPPAPRPVAEPALRPPPPGPSAERRPAAHPSDEAEDDLEDIAVTIGRVIGIEGPVIWGTLYDDADGNTAKAARMGALVSMRGPESRVFGIVNALRREQQSGRDAIERTVFEIQLLGEIANANKAAGFQRGVSSFPPLDAPVTTVTLRDLATVYARPRQSNVHVGRLRHNPKVPAFLLTDNLLGKHFAVLGTTGAGKSCAVTVILRSILDEHPNGHVVLLDPHNEYASAFTDKAELLNPSNLQLPYWLLNFEEIAHILIGDAVNGGNEHSFAQTAILKGAILRAKHAFAGQGAEVEHISVDTPVPYRLADLIAALKEGMGALNKSDGSGPYLGLISRIESLRADRRFAFMFASLAVRDTMRQVLAQLLRIPVAGKPITIMDISGVPSEIVDVVVSVLFRLVFELAVWSDRGAAPPVLLVCEEAHRYLPGDEAGGFAPTKRVISRIAKEGRKYGVTLCLVSQRPSELAIGGLSQCNTVFALRLTNEHDQAFVARALPENARWLVQSLPSLNTQEAVVVGDGVTVPVHIRFSDLTPDNRPSSLDPSFALSWREDADPTFLDRAIERWRYQSR